MAISQPQTKVLRPLKEFGNACPTIRNGYYAQQRPASFPWDSSHDCEFKRNHSAATRGVISAEERGYRRSTPLLDGVRFLQPIFCYPPKRWRLTTNIGFTPFESCTQNEQIQDIDGKIYSVSDSTKRLVCHDRSEGCILSYSDHQGTQEVPQIPFRGQSVSIPCSSFRISPGSTNLHKMHGRSSVPVAAPRHSCAKLPGRLAGISAITDSCTLSPRSRSKSSKHPGLTHESSKEGFDPLQRITFLGDISVFSRDECTIVSPERSVIHVMPSPLQSRSYSDGEFVPLTFGSNGQQRPL